MLIRYHLLCCHQVSKNIYYCTFKASRSSTCWRPSHHWLHQTIADQNIDCEPRKLPSRQPDTDSLGVCGEHLFSCRARTCDPHPLKTPWAARGGEVETVKWQTAGRRWHALLAKYSTRSSNSADRENIDTVIQGPPLGSEMLRGKTPPGCRHRPVCVQWSGVSTDAIMEKSYNCRFGDFLFLTSTECLLTCLVTFLAVKPVKTIVQQSWKTSFYIRVASIWQQWYTRCNCCPLRFHIPLSLMVLIQPSIPDAVALPTTMINCRVLRSFIQAYPSKYSDWKGAFPGTQAQETSDLY